MVVVPGFLLEHVNGLGTSQVMHFKWVVYPLMVQILGRFDDALYTKAIEKGNEDHWIRYCGSSDVLRALSEHGDVSTSVETMNIEDILQLMGTVCLTRGPPR